MKGEHRELFITDLTGSDCVYYKVNNRDLCFFFSDNWSSSNLMVKEPKLGRVHQSAVIIPITEAHMTTCACEAHTHTHTGTS